MKSLIRKEVRQIVLPLVLVLACLCTAWLIEFTFPNVLLRPDNDTVVAVLCAASIAGLLLGYVQFARERWAGTLGYLVHRGGGRRAAFRAKVVVGLVAAWLVGIVPVLVFTAVQACGPNASVIHGERVLEYAFYSLGVLVPYAAGAWTAHLRRGKAELAILVLVGGAGQVLVLGFGLWLAFMGLPLNLTWLLLELAVGGSLLVLAERAFEDSRDPELLLATRQHASAIVIGGLLSLVLIAGAVGWFQHWADYLLLASYQPVVQDVQTKELFFRTHVDGRDYRCDARGEPDLTRPIEGVDVRHRAIAVIDARGRPTGAEKEQPGDYRVVLDPGWQLGTLPRSGEIVRSRRDAGSPVRVDPRGWWETLDLDYLRYTGPRTSGAIAQWSFLDRGEGVVRFVSLVVEPYMGRNEDAPVALVQDPPFEVTAVRADGRPFSKLTRGFGDTQSGLCLVDLEDRTLWKVRYDGGGAKVEALPLPDGDELLSFEELLGQPVDSPLSIRGRKSDYDWEGERLVTRAEWEASPEGKVWLARRSEAFRAELTSADPIEPSVRLTEKSTGKEVFTAAYAPRTLRQKTLAGLLQLATFFKTPLGNLRAFLFGDPREIEFQSEWNSEALLIGHARPLLFLANMVWAALLVAWVVRRKRSYGYAPVVVALAGLSVAVFGTWAALWVCCFDPRGKPARAGQAAPQTAPELLIQSA